MKLYGFELGRKRELCLAELIAVFGEENFRNDITRIKCNPPLAPMIFSLKSKKFSKTKSTKEKSPSLFLFSTAILKTVTLLIAKSY